MPHDRKSFMLSALAAAGQRVSFTPVQIQKLFFLIDREAAALVEGPYFNFAAYDYGPFDKTIYDELDALNQDGFVETDHMQRHRLYNLTTQGFERGTLLLNALSPTAQKFMKDSAAWVKSLNFQQLVAAIYKRYPDMKENSIFR